MKPIYVLGVDPGEIAGWALIRAVLGKSELLYHGETGGKRIRKGRRVSSPSSGVSASEVIAKCQERLERPDNRGVQPGPAQIHFAIEDQFIPERAGIHEGRRAQAMAILGTARHCGGWEYAAQMHGLELYGRVHPDVWRKAQWGRARWRRDQAKRHAVEACKLVFGLRLPQSKHHTAEAAFIASWAAVEILHDRRMR